MIVLDTNVVSEIMRAVPSPAVIAWLNQQPSDTVYLTSTITAELLFGAARLPSGTRQSQLQTLLNEMLTHDFAGKVLPFDWAASQHYAALCADAQRQGQTIDMGDAQIAAVCLATGAKLATRNSKHFQIAGLAVMNPWDE